MDQWKRRLLIAAAGTIGLAVLILAWCFLSANYLVDIWWFESLGYLFYYWQRALYRYVVLISVTLLFFLIFFLNFWIASNYLGTVSPAPSKRRINLPKAYSDIVKLFRTGSLWVYTPLSLVLAIPIALPLFDRWEEFLLYLFAPGSGMQDPVYGKDISYYLFSFPIYTLLQRRLLIAFALLLAGLVALYWFERRLLLQRERRTPTGAKWHLSILIALIFLLEVWDFVLQRYDLLYTDKHQPLFYGAGYVEMSIVLPLVWLALLLFMGTSLFAAYSIHNRRVLRIFAGFAVCFALVLSLRYSSFFPETIQEYWVKPNAIAREKPYIHYNIQATLAAYNLTNVEVRDFNSERLPADITNPKVKTILRNTPVWDGELLDDVYKQLQELRTYYNFPTVDVDRYTVNGLYQQVFLSARELSQIQIPEAARTWVNEHLSYTHGYGAVMTPASQGGDEPMTWFIRGIPPESEYGFKIEQPGIYFGLDNYSYAIAPNDAGEIDYPKGNSNAMVNYAGKGGVPVSSLFRRAVFATYFKDRQLLFTGQTNKDSQILFRQNIIERIRTLTPYLKLDRDPYLVVTPQKLYWIQDAYTTSDRYPESVPYTSPQGTLNYIRNSVKIVVDAYDGSVDYYIYDAADPIIRAYGRIYPGLFKPADRLPPELAKHVRYPQDIFETQMAVYAKYHQADPEVFYQQEDVWEFSKTYQGNTPVTVAPYYLTLDLIDPGRFDFLSLVPMSPKGRDNLRALTLVGCDPPYYGRIVVYNFPKGELVYGPSQIYALTNQDTNVSQQFTLWDQSGSQVARGKMIILPIDRMILYIQPIYLRSATKLKIPELKRLIMSQGQVVVMEPSLEEAYTKLQDRIKADVEKVDRRFAPMIRAPGAPEGGKPAGSQ